MCSMACLSNWILHVFKNRIVQWNKNWLFLNISYRLQCSKSMSTKMKQLRWCLRYQGLTKSQTWTFFNKFCQLKAKNELLLWGLLSLKGLLSKWNIVVLLRTFLALSLNFTQNAAITWRWKLTFLHCGDGWRNRCSTKIVFFFSNAPFSHFISFP